eukprot:TRINITY_DN708_c0_g1_i1.p1 TRINITY_DN708_c0_g1~~TRINITY_DN708_c0_g1_i1.p1  ORF type:complete len:717 (-),score=278.23 TRINITY_DN708_c0_g1_i1:40-2016(-)
MEVEQKEGEEKEETEAKEEKPTPKKRGRKPKSAATPEKTEKVKPELPRSNSIQTRSKSLKRTHDKVEADPGLKAAHDVLEPLAKRARTTRGAVKVANNNIEASENLSDEEKEQLTMIYNLCDIDKDGKIDLFELEQLLRNLGFRPTIHEVSAIFKEADTDKSGYIEINEFLNLMANLQASDEEGGEEEVKEEKDEEEEDDEPSYNEEDEEEEEEKPKKRGRKPKKVATPKKKVTRTPKKVTRRKPLLSKGDSNLALKKTNEVLKLNRGLSISDFYTVFAGKHGEITSAKKDAFANPEGREYDLGREGAFGKFSVIVALLCPQHLNTEKFMANAGDALKLKGFRLSVVENEKEFIDDLDNHDVAWVVSNHVAASPAFVDAVKKFHESGRGLALWADNDPWFTTINQVLSKIQPNIQLQGNTPGGKVLSVGAAETKGQFGKHLVTSGLTNLFEGITLCYGNPTAKDWLETVATSTDGNPCVLAGDYENGLEDHYGRVLIDCGFTKLYHDWNTAGTGRYVRNVCVWLLGLDHRLAVGAELQGPIDKSQIKQRSKKRGAADGEKKQTMKWVWQYNHNGWFNYDNAASDVVEATYQEYLRNPGVTDVRSIQSGSWMYQVDFRQMTQQNIQHENHTIRQIRRVQMPVQESVPYSQLTDGKKKYF